jgi:hypothetical protein
LQVGGLFDGGQGGSELVGGAQVSQSPVGQLPDEPLAVGHRALAVVLVQLAHHDAQAVDEASGRNLQKKWRISQVGLCCQFLLARTVPRGPFLTSPLGANFDPQGR